MSQVFNKAAAHAAEVQADITASMDIAKKSLIGEGRQKPAHRVMFKVNCSGSWANLTSANEDNYDLIKAACLMIATATGVRFKVVSDSDETIMLCQSRKPGGLPEWDIYGRA